MTRIINIFFILFFSFITSFSLADPQNEDLAFSDPKELVLSLIDIVLNKEDFYKEDGFFEKMENYFDFMPMGRFVLGPPARSLNKEQLEEFVVALREYELLKMITQIQGQDITEVNFVSIQTSKDRTKLAFDFLTSYNSKPFRFNFYTRTNKKGIVKLYDLDIEGVRMLVRWKTEYSPLIADKGFEEMMSILTDRLEKKKSSLN